MSNFRLTVLFRISALLVLLLAAEPLMAQGDGIKKSKKTEVIDGKKYYLHTVEKGQTLFGISKAYGLSVNDVLVENPDALNGIKPGMVLRIPTQKPVVNTTPKPIPPIAAVKDTAFFLYTAEPGQTLYSIAQQNNTTVERLQQLNPELVASSLRAGQQIKVPGKPKPGTEVTTSPQTKPIGPDTTFRENKKAVYTVVIMLPFQLTHVDNIDTENPDKGHGFSVKAQAAVEFYEGALLAVDSIRKRGMNVNLMVLDVGEADSLTIEKVLQKPEMQQADLIIGPFDPAPFHRVAEFARKKNIAIVSPLSPSNRVLFKQPSSSKTTPALSTQMEQLAAHLGRTTTNETIILINSGNVKEQAAAGVFQKTMNTIRLAAGKDSIKVNVGGAGLEALLKKDRKNILIIPSGSQAYVTGLLLTLNGLSERYELVVYGMPVWMSFDNLDHDYLQKINLHFVTPYFIDYDNPATRRLLMNYRAAFKGDASQYVFAGYDVTLFFMNAMFTNGTLFYMKQDTLNADGLQQRFEFYRSEGESGFENRGIRIVRMEEYKLIREQ